MSNVHVSYVHVVFYFFLFEFPIANTLNNQFEQYLFGIKFNSKSHIYALFVLTAPSCLRCHILRIHRLRHIDTGTNMGHGDVCVCVSFYFIGYFVSTKWSARIFVLSPSRGPMAHISTAAQWQCERNAHSIANGFVRRKIPS